MRRLPRSALPLVLAAATLAGAGPLDRDAAADGERDLRRSPVVLAAERARPAVVSIHTTELTPQSLYVFELPPVEGKGVGSGVIFHPDGYVITNAHVISRARTVLVDVSAPDGSVRTHDARVFAVDLPHDLAIVTLLPRPGDPPDRAYPVLPLGRSDDLMVGETVVAIGNPFGIGPTVTTGVIGALHRDLQGPAPASQRGPRAPGERRTDATVLTDFIQIDAAINPGNSGGPLLDVTGRWIGVNTAIWNRQLTAAEGIGFAVPVDLVRALIGRAFERRRIRGDWLGLELEAGKGEVAQVRYLFPKGPAVGSGIREGDRVIAVNGRETPTLFDVRWRMASLPLGAPVVLSVARDAPEAGAAPAGEPGAAPAGEPGAGAPARPAGSLVLETVTIPLAPVLTNQLSDRHLGLVAQDVTAGDDGAPDFAFDAGVLVQAVRPDGPAAKVGLQPGDLVVGLGTYHIRDTDDLLVFLQYVRPGDLVKVHVVRVVRLKGGLLRVDRQEGTLEAE